MSLALTSRWMNSYIIFPLKDDNTQILIFLSRGCYCFRQTKVPSDPFVGEINHFVEIINIVFKGCFDEMPL